MTTDETESTRLVSGAELSGFLIPSQAPGVYARTGRFENVVAGLGQLITRFRGDDTVEILRFSPVIDRAVLMRHGYFTGFPHLAGCIHSFTGTSADHKRLLSKLISDEPTGDEFPPTACCLTPAACYPVYPLIAERGRLPPGGALIDVESYCFRHEPSADPTRMQSFRMRELVCLGSQAQVAAFRALWLQRAEQFVSILDLRGEAAPAQDPFFETGGTVLASTQKAEALKVEMLIPITVNAPPTACMSFNTHQTHFTSAWSIRTDAGELAHSGCVGFGLERLVLALLSAHGSDPECWPASVRNALWPVR